MRVAVRLALVVAMVSLVQTALGGRGGDTVDAGWATVQVHVDELGAPLESICLGDHCRMFEPTEEVRTGEFSAYVRSEESFVIRRVDESVVAAGPAPVGECLSVDVASGVGRFRSGCPGEQP